MRRAQRVKTENQIMQCDAYLKNHAVKPLQRIFTKLDDENAFPVNIGIENSKGELTKLGVEDMDEFVPTILPGAHFKVSNLKNDTSNARTTPYDLCMISQLDYDNVFKRNLGVMIDGMKEDQTKGIEDVLREYREQLDHMLSHNRLLISSYLSSNISKLNIAAVIDFFKKVYEAYPDHKDTISRALSYIITNSNVFDELIHNSDTKYNRGKFISYNPQIDPHLSVQEALYSMDPEVENSSMDYFMSKIQSRITFSAAEMTTNLYDILFKILAKIELSTHGLADLGYEWIMNCMDAIGLEVFMQYHDSLADMLMFTVIKVNATFRNYGTFNDAHGEIIKILSDVNRTFYPDDDYYDE